MGERGNRLYRGMDKWLGIPLTTLSASLRPGRGKIPHTPRRIGLLCLGAIGDLLLFSGLPLALRQRWPEVRLELLVTRGNAAAVPLVPAIDDVAAFALRDIPGMIAHLRQKRYDVLFDSSQWARLGTHICNFSGAGCTVGFITHGQYRSLGYDVKVRHSNERHEAANFLALGQALWPELQGGPAVRLPASPPQDALPFVRERAVFLHMWPSGVKSWLRQWPAEHWASLARHLLDRGCTVFLTGSPADVAGNTAFLQHWFPGTAGIQSLAGCLGLPSLAWLLAQAHAVVSVNTGIMHLAALAGAPTIGLHGPTNPLRWGPVGRQTASLLPREGKMAYLNLGFEYPPDACDLQYLPVQDVLDTLADWGRI